MKQYDEFIFLSYEFDVASKKAIFRYSFDDEIFFEENYVFDFDFVDYTEVVLDRAIQNLFFMAGVSYYKMYASEAISFRQGAMDIKDAGFFAEVYQKGLGEFFYKNGLNPTTTIPFEPNTDESTAVSVDEDEFTQGQLIGIGGGKDSLVAAEFLRDLPNVATWSLGHRKQLQPLVDKIGLPHFWVERKLDPNIKKLNKNGARNGHIPISAVFATCGAVVATLSGRSDIVVSNENSANEPNLTYRGALINHQFSKSQDFEELYQDLLKRHFDGLLDYYSFLRPLSELHIVELFVKRGFLDKYLDDFSSCNRAFTQDNHTMSWCGECPKCAFAYLALVPFADEAQLKRIFKNDLLSDSQLEITYKALLGIEGNKPLECVGEIKEAQSALQMAQKKRDDLKKFELSLPPDYDYRELQSDSMPEDIRGILLSELA